MTDQIRAGISEADLMRPEYEWFEVVNGEWVAIDTDMMGFLHTVVIHNLYDIPKPFVKTNDLGYVHGDGLKYILAIDEAGIETSRMPDLAFLRKGRIPADFDIQRPFFGAPDLAVEVASPGQTTAELLGKIADFLKYGTEEAWLIYPMKRQLHRYRRDEQAPEIYRDTQTIQSEALFPGLTIKIADLFIVEQA
jgi:hypothetical protein